MKTLVIVAALISVSTGAPAKLNIRQHARAGVPRAHAIPDLSAFYRYPGISRPNQEPSNIFEVPVIAPLPEPSGLYEAPVRESPKPAPSGLYEVPVPVPSPSRQEPTGLYEPPQEPSGLYEVPVPAPRTTTTTTTTTTTPPPPPPPQRDYLPPTDYLPPIDYLPPSPTNQLIKKTPPAPSPMMKPMPYEFGYSVDDGSHGPQFSHSERSDGSYVTGEYSVLLPDGRTQIVKFTSNPEDGYVAEVTFV